MGYCAVQERAGALFSAVAPDMKLEQTTQRSAKGPGGHYAVGSSRNTGSVTEFELLFHEVVAISSLLRKLTNAKLVGHTECVVQHSLYGSKGAMFHKNVVRLLDFVRAHYNLSLSLWMSHFITS